MRMYSNTSRRRHEPSVDSLPENSHYQDTGCEVSASCLSCTLPQCKYDDPGWYQQYRQGQRDVEIFSAYDLGLTVFQVAARFDVSPRTIHRSLRRRRAPAAAVA